jgi:hypothetical protein
MSEPEGTLVRLDRSKRTQARPDARIRKRSARSGTPQPGQKSRIAYSRPPLTHHAEIAAEWHRTKNGDLLPGDVTAGSGLRVWWRCSKNKSHEWQAIVKTRVNTGCGCPFCSGRRVTPATSLLARYPAIARTWHPTKNGTLRPENVASASGKRVWWQCPKDPEHEYDAAVASRTTGGTGCPYCAGQRTLPSTSLAAVAPEIAADWHPTKNGTLSPSHVRPSSSKRVWWRCPRVATHEWQTTVVHRTVNGSRCPFCFGHRASPENNLARLFPSIAADWDRGKNRGRSPETVRPQSGFVAFWKCALGHSYARVVAMQVDAHGHCPECVAAKRKTMSRAREVRRRRA